MASDKGSPSDPSRDAAGGDGRARDAAGTTESPARVSEDLDRIASYLRDSRSATFERASGLASEISQRRHEIAGRLSSGSAFANRLGQIARDLPAQRLSDTSSRPAPEVNRLLAERLHVFCREMDQLLDSFRSRVEHSKRVKH